MTDNSKLISERINQLLRSCLDNFQRQYDMSDLHWDIRPGRKYIKILMATSLKARDPNQEITGWSVWCFIDKETGAVYKPADYRGPAKGIRYHLLDDDSYADACQRVNWSGGWLYLRG